MQARTAVTSVRSFVVAFRVWMNDIRRRVPNRGRMFTNKAQKNCVLGLACGRLGETRRHKEGGHPSRMPGHGSKESPTFVGMTSKRPLRDNTRRLGHPDGSRDAARPRHRPPSSRRKSGSLNGSVIPRKLGSHDLVILTASRDRAWLVIPTKVGSSEQLRHLDGSQDLRRGLNQRDSQPPSTASTVPCT